MKREEDPGLAIRIISGMAICRSLDPSKLSVVPFIIVAAIPARADDLASVTTITIILDGPNVVGSVVHRSPYSMVLRLASLPVRQPT